MPIREDLLLVGYASYVVELLDRFTYEEGENPALYRLLSDTLSRLATKPDPAFTVRYYEVRLLDLLGFRPQLFHCARCGREIMPEDQYFSAEQGGVLCPVCGKATSGAVPISMPALKYLRHFQRSMYSEARRASLTVSVNREMEMLMQHYFTYLLGAV
jgi:DNA repair protein RecO (recombination protein O)